MCICDCDIRFLLRICLPHVQYVIYEVQIARKQVVLKYFTQYITGSRSFDRYCTLCTVDRGYVPLSMNHCLHIILAFATLKLPGMIHTVYRYKTERRNVQYIHICVASQLTVRVYPYSMVRVYGVKVRVLLPIRIPLPLLWNGVQPTMNATNTCFAGCCAIPEHQGFLRL